MGWGGGALVFTLMGQGHSPECDSAPHCNKKDTSGVSFGAAYLIHSRVVSHRRRTNTRNSNTAAGTGVVTRTSKLHPLKEKKKVSPLP